MNSILRQHFNFNFQLHYQSCNYRRTILIVISLDGSPVMRHESMAIREESRQILIDLAGGQYFLVLVKVTKSSQFANFVTAGHLDATLLPDTKPHDPLRIEDNNSVRAASPRVELQQWTTARCSWLALICQVLTTLMTIMNSTMARLPHRNGSSPNFRRVSSQANSCNNSVVELHQSRPRSGSAI